MLRGRWHERFNINALTFLKVALRITGHLHVCTYVTNNELLQAKDVLLDRSADPAGRKVCQCLAPRHHGQEQAHQVRFLFSNLTINTFLYPPQHPGTYQPTVSFLEP